jgi:hypothetical protein
LGTLTREAKSGIEIQDVMVKIHWWKGRAEAWGMALQGTQAELVKVAKSEEE